MDTLGTQVTRHIHQVTGLAVTWCGPAGVELPPFLAGRFTPYRLTVAGIPRLAVVIKGAPPAPGILQKQVHRLLQLLDMDAGSACLVAEQLTPYLRRRLVEMRMPFLIPGQQLFWPALGYAETAQRPRRLRPQPVARIAPSAQQLLVALLLRCLPGRVNVSQAAEALGYTAMSMSRAVKQLEGAGWLHSAQDGRFRTLTLSAAPQLVWEQVSTRLRSPVQRSIRVLRRDLPAAALTAAGETALARLTSLAPPGEAVFAIASREWSRHHRQVPQVPMPDTGTCCVQLWHYRPAPTARHGSVDPLSLHLSLRDTADERVQAALDELMEQVEW